MKQLLSRVENSRIANLVSTKQKLTANYLSDTLDPQTAFIVAKYFKQNTRYLDVVNLSFGLLGNIANIYNDYTAEPKLNFDIDINGIAYDMCWAGYGVLVASIENGKLDFCKVNPEGYIKDSKNKERLLFVYEIIEGELLVYYILEKTYIVEKSIEKDVNGIEQYIGKTRIENKLYKLINRLDMFNAMEVPIDSISYTVGIPEVEYMNIGRSPIFVFNNQKIDNLLYGNSEYDKIKSIIQSLEIQAVNIQDQLLKHLQAKLLMPRMAMSTKTNSVTGKKSIDLSEVEVVEIEEGQTFTPQYVTNTNALLPHAFTYFDLLLDRFSAITQIPKEILAIKGTGGAESEATKLIRFSAFIKKIDKYREIISGELEDIFEFREQLGYGDGSDFVCLWKPVLPSDESVSITNVISLQSAGLMSKLKAIMKAQDISLEDAGKELELIKSESVDIGFENTLNQNTNSNMNPNNMILDSENQKDNQSDNQTSKT